jgi:hypothetical protein
VVPLECRPGSETSRVAEKFRVLRLSCPRK